MANDFSADSTCIALYNGELSAEGTDSKGTDTLTNSGAIGETGFVKQGSYSLRLIETDPDYLYRTDTNLSSGFPLKSGTANKTISVCAWAYIVTAPDPETVRWVAAKWEDASGNHRTFGGRIVKTGGSIFSNLVLGSTIGTETEYVQHGTALSLNTPYHFTYGYRDSDKAYRLFVRDTNGNVLGSDLSGTATNNIALFSQSDWMIGVYGTGAAPAGGTNYWGGYLDEIVVFSKLITATDATNIAKGLYSGTGDSGGTSPAVSDTATIAEDVKMHMPISLKMMKVP